MLSLELNLVRKFKKGLWSGENMRIERDFVDQVIRITVTHPGVTAEGIMNKMEVNDIHKQEERL